MEKITATVIIPKGVEVKIEKGFIIAKGKKGECKRTIADPRLHIEMKDGNIMLSTVLKGKKGKRFLYSLQAHIKNLISGAADGHSYVLKICASHFPMNVAVSNKQLIVKNLLGEKFPRTLPLKEGVSVKVEGDKITVESADVELAGTTASDIEKLAKRASFDPRIFQDGIYIISKDGQSVS